MTLQMVEQDTESFPRIDAMERATGRAKYAADWKVPDMLYARTIASTVPHGTVRRVDTEAAERVLGVRSIITCMDDETVWHAGERQHVRYVFARRVRFLGDCIGAVAADSRAAAREAAGLVRAEYEPLPAVFVMDESAKPDAPRIWEDGNVLGPLSYGFGTIEDGFREADLVVEGVYETSRVHNAPMEPAASLAWWEGDRLTVVAGTQSLFGCRDGLSKDLGIPPENVRVIALYKGGGFGNKNSSMNYDLAAALLAKKTGRPVMMEYSREDDIVGVHGRWASRQRLRAAVDGKKGRLIAVDLEAHCDVGGYTRHIVQGKFVNGAEDYYSCDAWKANVYAVYTNTPGTGHMRAPSGPQACFASETLADEISHRLGLDPLEFRLRNYAKKHQGTEEFTSNGMGDCLLLGAERFGWKTKWRQAPPKVGGGSVHRGVGLAMAMWHSFLGKGEAALTIRDDGEVDVFAGVVDIGTGAKSTMAIIAARALSVPLGRVHVIWGDTALCPYSIGESGSRTTTFTGYAVQEAARKAKDRLLALASERFGVPPTELTMGDGTVSVKGGRGVSIRELMKSSGLKEISEKAESEPTLPEGKARYAFAAHFAEVEVDMETGLVAVTKYVAAHDSGTIINKLTAESQVRGSIVMGVGMAFSERLQIDLESGSVLNPNFFTYRLPNNTMTPPVDVIFVKSDDAYGPKSLGEIAVLPVPAAIGNAIFNATGLRLRSLPFGPEEVLRERDS